MCKTFMMLICSILVWTIPLVARAEESQPDSADRLLNEIIPENGPVRPPYEFARYDMGLEPQQKIDDLKTLALARQTAVEARFDALKEARGTPPADPAWTILKYAFGEESLQPALQAAHALGDAWRLRFARLLVAECRYDTAVQELIALADTTGDCALAALTQLVLLDRSHSAIDGQLAVVPLKADLKTYLEKRAQDPVMARVIDGIGKGIRPPLSSSLSPPPLDQAVDEQDLLIEDDDPRHFNGENIDLDTRNGWAQHLHTAESLLGPSYVFESLDKRFLETFSTRLVLYRELRHDDIVTTTAAPLKLHTDCGGPIAFKLYRFTDRQKWERLDARTFTGLEPSQTWEETFRALRENNRGAAQEYDVQARNLDEGYYLITAEARYLPLLAAQKFLVSHVALYLRTTPNQALVAAVDRRSGAPIPQLPLELAIQGHPDLRCAGPEFAARPASFRAGFDGEAAPNDYDPLLAPHDYAKSMQAYQAGQSLRSRYPDVQLNFQKSTDSTGIAVFPLSLEQGYDFSLSALAPSVCFAEATTPFSTTCEPEYKTKCVVWTAQPLYRPGDPVHFKGVVRRFNGLRLAPHAGDGPKQVQVVVKSEKEQLWEGTCDVTNAGCFSGTFTISATASLGTYDLQVDGVNAHPASVIKVAHFKVPTLNVSVTLPQVTEQGGRKLTGEAQVRYSFGKPAGGAEVEISLECGEKEPVTKTFFTDARGIVSFDLPLPTVPTETRAMVRATALDAAGESYSGFAPINITPVAFCLRADVTHRERFLNGQESHLRLHATDWAGKPLEGVTVALIGTRTTEQTDRDGAVSIPFTTIASGQRQDLQLVAIRERDVVHLEQTVFLEQPAPPTEAGEAANPQPVLRDHVELEVPWTCNAGDTVTANLKLERKTAGKALVLLFAENTRALFHRVLYVEPGTQSIELPTDLDCTPTFNVEAVMLTGMSCPTAKRYIRVKPIQRFLTLQVLTDKEQYRPGETCLVEIQASDWQQHPVAGAEVSLGVVNESLYRLKSDPTPDLQRFFYDYHLPHLSKDQYDAPPPLFPAAIWVKGPKLAWGFWARAEGSFGHRSGGGRRRFGSYGGGSAASGRANTRINFRNEAHWVADLITDPDGKARARFVFPDDITFWRFTARGVTPDTLVGEVRVQHRTFLPAQVEWALPRALRAGDRIAVASVVHNNTQQPRQVALNFDLDAGNGTHELSIPEEGSVRMTVPVHPDQPLPLKLKAAVLAADNKDGDAIERVLNVMPGGYPVSRTFQGTLTTEASIPLAFELSMPPDHLKLDLCVEPGVIGPVTTAIDQLISYPYGCVEQTMSRFLPAVIAQQAMKRVKRPFAKEKELPEILDKGLERLAGFQHPDGGWGWWKNDPTNRFMTAYVLEGLTLCLQAGHPVPNGILDRAAECAFKQLSEKQGPEEHTVYSIGEVSSGIYIAHALALFYAAQPERFGPQSERLKRLLPEVEKYLPFPRDRVLLADTCRLLGMQERARELLGQLQDSIRPDAHDRASILATATFMEVSQALQTDRATNITLARQLLAMRRGARWMDTQVTAAIVRGLTTLIGDRPAEPLPVDVCVDGKVIARLEPKGDLPTRLVLANELIKAQSVTLKPVGQASSDTFWSAQLSGYASEAPPQPDQATARVTCLVYRTGDQTDEILPDAEGRLNVKRGETLRIRVCCQTGKTLDYLRVSLPRPCGVELVQPPRAAGNAKSAGFASFEEHDDAFHFFIDRLEKDFEIDFLVRAQVSGQVFSPPPDLEPMYGDTVPVQHAGPREWVIAE